MVWLSLLFSSAALVLSQVASTGSAAAKNAPGEGKLQRPPAELAASSRSEPAGLTPDLVYAVLVAQIAHQRNDLEMAFTHYLHAARLAKSPELAELATRVALAQKNRQSIERGLALWLELAPESAAAHQVAAYVSLEEQDVKAARAHLRQVVRLSGPNGDGGYLQAARLIQRLADHDQRVALMRELTEADPDNAEAWFALAMVAAGVERYDDAADAASRAAALRPAWTEPRVFLVQLLVTQGETARAREVLERFVRESPEDQSLGMLLAQLLIEEGELAQARSLLQEMLTRQGSRAADILFALGVLSMQAEDYEAARGYFGRLREITERRDDGAYYLGQVEELAERPQEALGWYLKVQGQHALDARVRAARLRARLGDVAAAREDLQQLRVRWSDEAVTLYLVEAEILREAGRNQEAMTVYDDALRVFPDQPDLLYARAMHAIGQDRLDLLERDLRAIIARDPDHADALNALGYTLADRTDRLDEARGYIERAFALKPDDAAILDSMGWINYRQGRLEEALNYLRRAFDLMQDAEIAAHLGEVLWVLGQRDEAWKIWEEALEADPDHEYLLRVIGRHRYSQSSP